MMAVFRSSTVVTTRTGDVAAVNWSSVLYRRPARAALKVSFFGPFYGGYNVIALDREYRHALVCGPDRDYLWILSRTPTLSPEMKQQMLDVATRQGFDVSKLIWVEQPH
jgi:apolipoprotein D and lipocalin family protein